MKTKKFRKNSRKQLRSKKQMKRSRKQKRTRKQQKAGSHLIEKVKGVMTEIENAKGQMIAGANQLSGAKAEVLETLKGIREGIAEIPSDISKASNEFIKSLQGELDNSLEPFKQQIRELQSSLEQIKSHLPTTPG